MTTMVARKEALKEDVKHVLEELQDAEEEEPFFKIFTRECEKGTKKVMRCSKVDLQDLSHRDYDLTVH